jgi:dTDP-4-dehydrorhamnose reductase
MKILVTGGEGQLGHALRRVKDGNEWLFTDLPQMDITDREAVNAFFDRERPEVVVNCAAFTDVDRAESEREAAYRVNRDAPQFLAEACARTGAAIVHVSTDFVFDGSGDRPYTEEDEPAPLNVYGESKLAGERAVMQSGARGAVVRTSWLYSPWGKNFVKAIMRVAAERDEISVVADQIGCPTSAVSLAAAIVTTIPALVGRPAAVYQFCDAGVVSRADFAVEIIRQAGLACRVVPVSSSEYTSPAERPLYSALDTAKITRTFGIAPLSWAETLAECINEIQNGR